MTAIMIAMKVDRPTREAHGAALLAAAAKLFRGRGIGAVRVADVSAAAGLTHGAFYGHFPSKAALAEAACRGGLEEAAQRWHRRAARARAEHRDPVGALIDAYLTERHRDAPEDGCVLSSLGPEISRAEPPLRAALADGAGLLADVLAEEIAAGHPDAARERINTAAEATLAAMVGGLALARAYATDPARSRAALDAAAALARRAADPTGKD
jgi:TetR/AcrR family transcriptional regulator, transcriptional repressor for nem operon